MRPDYVTIWNGTLERNWIRSQQRRPDPVQLRPTPGPTAIADDIVAYLQQVPSATIRAVSEATDRDIRQVGFALHQLRAEGRVVLETRPDQRDWVPMQWSVRRD